MTLGVFFKTRNLCHKEFTLRRHLSHAHQKYTVQNTSKYILFMTYIVEKTKNFHFTFLQTDIGPHTKPAILYDSILFLYLVLQWRFTLKSCGLIFDSFFDKFINRSNKFSYNCCTKVGIRMKN